MTSFTKPDARKLQGAALAAALLFVVSPTVAQRAAPAAAGGPFAGLAGTWQGNGTITLAGGNNERIRCRATYNVDSDGNGLQQNLRCASDSYRFDLTSAVTSRGGSLSGNWSESTRNLAGNVSGSASSGQIQARVSSPGFTADLLVSTRGNSQAVTISSSNSELSGVNITMRRG
jgi:hypothetical protein